MSKPIVKTLPSLFLWQALSIVAGFVTQIVLARSLGPHDKGIVDLFLLIPFVAASILDLGLLSANTYFAGKKTFPLTTLHSNTLVWTVGAGIIAIMGGFLLAMISGPPFPSLSLNQFLLAITIVLPLLYFSLWSGLMYGSDQASHVYTITGITSLLSMAAYGVVVTAGASLETILLVSAGLAFLKAVIPFIWLSRIAPPRLVPDTHALRLALRYGIALYIGITINTLHVRVSQFLVESTLGATELGYYALAVRIAEMVWLLDFVIINASVFRITSTDLRESARITQRMTRMIGLMVTAFSLGIATAAPFMVPLLFGKEFSPAVVPLLLLFPGIIGWSLARSLAQFISYQVGKPWYNTRAAAAAFVLNIILNLVFIPVFGVAGASLASSVSYISNLAILTFVFRRLSGSDLLPTFFLQRGDIPLVRELVMNSVRTVFLRRG